MARPAMPSMHAAVKRHMDAPGVRELWELITSDQELLEAEAAELVNNEELLSLQHSVMLDVHGPRRY